MSILDQIRGCCCDQTAHYVDVATAQVEHLRQDALYNMQLAQLRQQIDQANDDLARMQAEEMARHVEEATTSAYDLSRYHAGRSEVIDVEPVSCESLGRGGGDE